LLPERWLAGGFASLESNDELDLDLRSSIGAAGGRILRQSNRSRIQLVGGLVLTEERVSAPTESRTESAVEGLFGADPNLSDMGRYRTSFDTDFRWEIISDLFWGFTLYHRYDNEPIADGSGTDYGVTTSLGWKF
jgi:hypothetical protein